MFTAIMVKDPAKDRPIDTPGPFRRIIGFDYVLFTNVQNAKAVFANSGWTDIREQEPPPEDMPRRSKRGWPIYANRWFKWHPDRVFLDYDVAIYVDGFQVPHPELRHEWWRFVRALCDDPDPKTPRLVHSPHHANKCIYDEQRAIVRSNKDTAARMSAVTAYVRSHGYPANAGLLWNGCYIYRLGCPKIKALFDSLWEDMVVFTYRDQSLYMFEIWKTGAFSSIGAAPLDKMVMSVDTNHNHVYT